MHLIGVDPKQAPQRDARALSAALGYSFDIIGEACYDFGIVAKSVEAGAKLAAEDEDMVVEGIVSTEQKDLQGEVVAQDGIDWDYFEKWGWLNDVHKDGAGEKVGQPISIKKITLPDGTKATQMRARLLKTDAGKKIWDVAKATTLDPKITRKLQFSVQGPLVKREGNRIVRMVATDVAVTGHGINKGTTLKAVLGGIREIKKSLDAGYPAGDVDGGGNLAPLMTQDLEGAETRRSDTGQGGRQGRAERRKARTIGGRYNSMDMDKELQGLTDEEKARALAAIGKGTTPGVQLQKTEEILKSVESHVANKGFVRLLTQADLDAEATVAGLLSKLVNADGAAVEQREMIAKGLVAIGDGLRALSESQVALVAEQKRLAALVEPNALQAVVAKSLEGAPAGGFRGATRDDATPAPAVKPPEAGGATEAKALSYAIVRKSLDQKWAEAEKAGDTKVLSAIASLYQKQQRHVPLTAEDLKSVGVTVEATA